MRSPKVDKPKSDNIKLAMKSIVDSVIKREDQLVLLHKARSLQQQRARERSESDDEKGKQRQRRARELARGRSSNNEPDTECRAERKSPAKQPSVQRSAPTSGGSTDSAVGGNTPKRKRKARKSVPRAKVIRDSKPDTSGDDRKSAPRKRKATKPAKSK